MRLFVALEVPEAVRAAVAAAVAPLRDRYPRLRWTRPDAWHLTLAFLGEVDAGRAEGLADTLAPAAGATPEPVSLSLSRPDRFGRRVLWLGVEDEPAGSVPSLGERLQDAAATVGIDVDRKDVRPHLTLARSRGRQAVDREVVSACPVVSARWSVDRAVLFQSHLAGGPARYEALASLPFGAGATGSGS